MNLPDELDQIIQNKIANNKSFEALSSNAKSISERYRNNANSGTRLLTKSDEAIAYSLARMPATYGAVYTALSSALENADSSINTVFDIGAGTGAGTWAAYEMLGNKNFVCYEREDAMIEIGEKIMSHQKDLSSAEWQKFDIVNDIFSKKCDLSIVSYMINELPKEHVLEVISKIWSATNEVMLIVEPGTPTAFENIKTIRQHLIDNGGFIVSPCTHQNKCEIAADDWCAFSCRVQRAKLHKMLKEGDAPFEDEKFSYIAFSKKPVHCAEARILRHPIINKGYSEFKVCTPDGIKNIKLSKKDGEKYKISKKKSAGDTLEL